MLQTGRAFKKYTHRRCSSYHMLRSITVLRERDALALDTDNNDIYFTLGRSSMTEFELAMLREIATTNEILRGIREGLQSIINVLWLQFYYLWLEKK
jgi:hypothetical protein